MVKYPKVFKGKVTGVVVEFTSLTTGKVLELGEIADYEIGEVVTTWMSHTNTVKWKPVVTSVKQRLHLEVKNYG